MAEPASKVFLTQDFCDNWYMCYMISSRFRLAIVKIDFSSNNINFGIATSISAKDAISIPVSNWCWWFGILDIETNTFQQPHMLAILEHNGNVCLYSGLTVVGKLHVGGTLAPHTPSPFVRRHMHNFTSYSPFPR